MYSTSLQGKGETLSSSIAHLIGVHYLLSSPYPIITYNLDQRELQSRYNRLKRGTKEVKGYYHMGRCRIYPPSDIIIHDMSDDGAYLLRCHVYSRKK